MLVGRLPLAPAGNASRSQSLTSSALHSLVPLRPRVDHHRARRRVARWLHDRGHARQEAGGRREDGRRGGQLRAAVGCARAQGLARLAPTRHHRAHGRRESPLVGDAGAMEARARPLRLIRQRAALAPGGWCGRARHRPARRHPQRAQPGARHRVLSGQCARARRQRAAAHRHRVGRYARRRGCAAHLGVRRVRRRHARGPDRSAEVVEGVEPAHRHQGARQCRRARTAEWGHEAGARRDGAAGLGLRGAAGSVRALSPNCCRRRMAAGAGRIRASPHDCARGSAARRIGQRERAYSVADYTGRCGFDDGGSARQQRFEPRRFVARAS